MSGRQKQRVDEEDDLDDLDDVLDQFAPSAQPTSPPRQPPSAGPSTSAQPTTEGNDGLSEDFAAELAKGMASLFQELGIEPGAEPSGPDGAAERERLAAAWEAMLVEGMDAMSVPSNARASADASSPRPRGDDFQSRIQSAVNKLKESESGLKSSDSSASDGGDDTFQALLSQLGELRNLPDGADVDNEEQLQGVLEAMMGSLMGKDVLYEPLKELHDKFPAYLRDHASTISPEDKRRFDAQIVCISQLIAEFESASYRDEDEKARGKIVELMSELQTHGSPPEEIMGPLPPGFSMGTDGLPDVPGCDTQ